MNVLEKEIEDLIWDCVQNDITILKDRGLYLPPDWKYFRQVNLGSYGIADMIAVKITAYSINVIIYELKKDTIGLHTLLQAVRYGKALQRLLADKRYLNFSFCLIGKQINHESDFCYLPDLIDNVSVYTYEIDLKKGLRFNRQCGFRQTSETLPKLNFSISDIKQMF